MTTPEAIRSAAIQLYNGEVTGTGRDHMAAWRDLHSQGYVSDTEYPTFWKVRVTPAAGFMTTRDRFVSRVEALKIARAADQLKADFVTRHSVEGLDSADLDIPGALSKPDSILLGTGRGMKVDLRDGHHDYKDRFARGLPYESAEKIVAHLLDES